MQFKESTMPSASELAEQQINKISDILVKLQSCYDNMQYGEAHGDDPVEKDKKNEKGRIGWDIYNEASREADELTEKAYRLIKKLSSEERELLNTKVVALQNNNKITKGYDPIEQIIERTEK